MAQKKSQLMSESDAKALMALPKTASPRLTWNEDSVHSGTKIIAFSVRVAGRRDLLVELTARMHHRVDRTIIEYGLFKVDPIFRQQERVYQLAIDDPRYITHREAGKPNIYGSHEVIGNLTIALPQCNNISFSEGLTLFLNAVNLELDDGPIEDPFALNLR